ncbi:MAG: hypothetical protein ACTSQH_05750 [Candidatus Hodarchaeales archaeon]
MSITGFDEAIKDQVSHYSDTLGALRDSEILQRSNALAGLQSQVEKYGEIAKLGLEFPIAIEGLKVTGGTFKKGYNWARGIKADADEGMSTIRDLLAGGDRGKAARGAISTALSRTQTPGTGRNIMSHSELSDRFDNIRSGVTSRSVEANSIMERPPGMEEGKIDDDGTQLFRERVEGGRATGRNPGEAGRRRIANRGRRSLAEDMENTDRPEVNRMGSINSGEGKAPTSTRVPLDATGGTKVSTEDDFGLPKEGASMEMVDRAPTVPDHSGIGVSHNSSMTDETGVEMDDRSAPRPSMRAPQQTYESRTGMDTEYQFEPDDGTSTVRTMSTRGGATTDIGELSRTGGQPAEIRQLSSGTKGAGEIRGATAPASDVPTGSKPPRTFQRMVEEGGEEGVEPDISPTEGGSLITGAEDEAASIAASTAEESLGAGLLLSGIFAPIGALLEGVGAVTEVASVAAGTYGAVRSMVDSGREDALRDTPLAPINRAPLDLGGRIGVPLLKYIHHQNLLI